MMNCANYITASRISLAPVFLFLFSLHIQSHLPILIVGLVLVFLISEFSDLLDGLVARRYQLNSDLGKLLDTFADIINRLTVFLCLLIVDLLPLAVFAIIFYRELSIIFLRLLMIIQEKHVQEARTAGKIKSLAYCISSGAGLSYYCFNSLPHQGINLIPLWWITQILFWLSAALSLWSFLGYLIIYYHIRKSNNLEKPFSESSYAQNSSGSNSKEDGSLNLPQSP